MSASDLRLTLSIRDIVGYVAFAAIDTLIALGLFIVAPAGLGQWLGVTFAILLLPVPPVVLYFTRWRKAAAG